MAEEFETWAGALGSAIAELESFGYRVKKFSYLPESPEGYSTYPYGWVLMCERT